VFGDQVGPAQLGHQAAGRRHRDAGQARRRRRGEVRPGVQAEEPEQPGRRVAQRPVRPGEHGADVGGLVRPLEHVEAAGGIAQLGGERRQRLAGVDGGPGGDHGQREGKPGAPGDDLVDRVRLGVDAARADPPGQHRPGLVGGEHVEGEQVRALGGDQGGEVGPAGHDGGAAGRAGQERSDLGRVACVVQYDQDAPAGQQAAVQRHLPVGLGRHPLRRYAQRLQEAAYRLGRVHRGLGRVEAAQVDVELSVGEPVGHPVGPVQGEGGLADSGGAGDGADGGRRRPLPRVGGQDGVELAQLPRPAGESADVRRKLSGNGGRFGARGRLGGWLGGRTIRDAAPQDPPVEDLERVARFGAEFLAQHPAGVLEDREGLRRPAGLDERTHQPGPELLPERVLHHQAA